MRRLFIDPILAALGGLVLLITSGVYFATVARTVPFWDCGEFIACSHILGIPHPPGTPLFVILGRVFAILPFVSDPSHRINLFSSLSSAAAATVAYFVLARIITWWYSDNYPDPTLGWGQRLSIYAGSVCGALMFAFASTNWSNSVEAEVYGLSMFLMMSLVWLALIWSSKREEPGSDRYLVLIAFIAFLSIGVHMTVFIAMPPIFLFVILMSPRLRKDWRFWLTGAALFLVTGTLATFMWGICALGVLAGVLAAKTVWNWKLTVWTVLVIGGGFAWTFSMIEPWLLLTLVPWPLFLAMIIWGVQVAPWSDIGSPWRLSFLILVAALLGYSTHMYLPVRAQQNPAINENDPKSWRALSDFLERKQYGDQSMIARAMTRRGEWSNQLGQHPRMGFWGFFDRQYGFSDKAFFPILGLGLIGVFQLLRIRRSVGVLFLALLLITSIGLIWYMNFADGTKYNPATQDAYLEVRDRDYFFTPAFILFGMAIGLGGAALIRWLIGGSIVWPIIGATVIAVLPVRAIQANYFVNDRSRNVLAYDYAFNLLSSVDRDALFFTNGDNDTFPVWCLQEVYGFRRDVQVINLSLLNTHWYIKQLRDIHNVPMDLSDDDLQKLGHYRKPDGGIHRIQDQMIDRILLANKGKRPVNFAVTVTESNRRFRERSLESNLVITGMAFRLVSDSGANRVDVERVDSLLWNVFQYRGVNDPTIYKDENAQRMASNYISGFFFIADTLRKAGDYDRAIRQMRRAQELLPDIIEPYVYLAQLYTDTNQPDSLESLYLNSKRLKTEWERVGTAVGYSMRRLGMTSRAEQVLKEVMAVAPTHEPAYKTLVQLYYQEARYDSLLGLMENWARRNPNDGQTRSLLDSVRTLVRLQTAAPDTGRP
jgi:tetratricopeptide (TPR) repeat protein